MDMIEWMRRALDGEVEVPVVGGSEVLHHPPTQPEKWNDNSNFMALGNALKQELDSVVDALRGVVVRKGNESRGLAVGTNAYTSQNEELAKPGEVGTGFHVDERVGQVGFHLSLHRNGFHAVRKVADRDEVTDLIPFVEPITATRQSLARLLVSLGNVVREAGWRISRDP
jgi:hypothetical protein